MRLIFPRLGLLWLVCLLACSNEDPRGPGGPLVDAQAGNEGGEPDGVVRDAGPGFERGLDGGMDASLDASKPDAVVRGGGDGGMCPALGCDELGYECGSTVDNCGDPLNCNLEDNKSPCSPPERCGGDPDRGPHKCGCKARPDACAASGAQCGLIDECGKQINCGDCANGAVCIGNSCNCSAVSNACGTKVCGSAPDGCGGTVKCGPSAGLCSVGVCEPTAGTCACPPSAQVCAGKTGPVTVSGCDYTCGGLCVPDDVAACAGAECGTARNNCGDTVNCGPLAGACAPGNTCIGTQYVLDSALPARSGSYGGGYCVADGVAHMLGKYAVRIHSFRQAGNTSLNFLNRAEATSLVTVDYSRATGQARYTDYGCTATTVGDPANTAGGATTKSVIPKYRNLAPAIGQLRVSGDQFTRLEVDFPNLGLGSPSGFVPGMPSFCVGFEGQEVDLPAGDSRRGKWWADNRCSCPTAANAATLPGRPGVADPNNYSTTPLRDCRIVDDDLDGKPGFTGKASVLFITSELYNANISHGTWQGAIRADRYHVGYMLEPNPVLRVVVGCLATGFACAVPGVDCACAERWQTVQFVPLPDTDPMTCDRFHTNLNATNEAVNQNAVDMLFSVPFGTCSGAGQCPAGSICRGNRCFTQTAKGACTVGAQNPCPANTFCEGCPNDPGSPEVEMTCRTDTACWPSQEECPTAGSPVGGFCTATPP